MHTPIYVFYCLIQAIVFFIISNLSGYPPSEDLQNLVAPSDKFQNFGAPFFIPRNGNGF